MARKPTSKSASKPKPVAIAGTLTKADIPQLAGGKGGAITLEANVGVGIVPETTVQRSARTMKISAVQLTDAWALRDLNICVRNVAALPPYARQLVDHLREERREIT